MNKENETRKLEILALLAKNDLFGGISAEEEKRLKEELASFDLKTKPPTFDEKGKVFLAVEKKYFNTFCYAPVLKETRNPHVAYMNHTDDVSLDFNLIPAIYVGIKEEKLNDSVACIRSLFPNLVIEKRKSNRTNYPVELKLTNGIGSDVLGLSYIDWDSVESEEGYIEINPELYLEKEGVLVYGHQSDMLLVQSFNNKSLMGKWLNFLRRGKTISGDSSLIAGSLVEQKINVPLEERLGKGKHHLFIFGLTLPQVESILDVIAFSHCPNEIDESFFSYGFPLSTELEQGYVEFQKTQTNY